MDPILFFLLTLSILLVLMLISIMVLPEYIAVKELEKHVGKWVSFTQLSHFGNKTGVVRHGKLLKVQSQFNDVYVCCFKLIENPDAKPCIDLYNMPKEFDMSWKMLGETTKKLFYKDLKLANNIGEL